MHLKIQDARLLKRTASVAEANKLLGEMLPQQPWGVAAMKGVQE
jgi:hypothetical protein